MANNVNPVIVTASELEVHYGEHIILNKASLSVHEGDRIGLVGRNGSGKSTFLKIIAGVLEPDSGYVARRRDLRVGYLPQEFTLDFDKSVYENINEGAAEIISLLNEYENLPHDSDRRHLLEEKILAADGWNLDNRIKIIMQSLNAPEADRIVGTLSGGEKRRVAMCKALISHPDFLILDEPTNHLDTESIEWTEQFLAEYSGTCLFVTHDRYFLDRIANRIVELSSGEFYSHAGNYTDYLINKAERMYLQEQEENKRQSFLRRELEWVRKGPRARRTKAKSRLDQYFEVASQKAPEREMDVDMIIPPASKPGTKILNLKNLGMELGGKKLFGELDLIFEQGRKLGVVGKNGLGKTTLLRVILGELPPTEGRLETGDRTVFNYVDQSRLLLNDEKTVLEEIGEGRDFITFGDEKITVWKYLRRFLFTDDRINTKIERLSGGEKSRLLLARILKNGGNFLILDEPTNDLDLPTLRILEEALSEFEGCAIVVSHDRYFLNRVCNGILAFEGDGKVVFSEGDYDYYLEKRNIRRKEAIQKLQPAVKPSREEEKPKPAVRKLKWKEAKELETIEEDIMTAETEVARIESIFSAPDFYEKYAKQTTELTAELDAAKEKVKALYDRWEELEKIKRGEPES
ncbi:MAG: ABC-F family ATP-binding cassette domain-containing protein [Ignavibacteriales bacterium]